MIFSTFKILNVSGNQSEVPLFDLSAILPVKEPAKMNHFYRYEGSLTTPPCSEVVEWTVFRQPLYLSSEQYLQFVGGKNPDGSPMINTFRPVQPLNGRKVFSSIGHDNRPVWLHNKHQLFPQSDNTVAQV